ncbi:MAG: hypothetical protein LBN95_04075 [Prevotellaceae bacterium]|jgi:hypothetical protein|nr:hypothetical protein [Prevotellaceae bacterium]
MKKRKLKTEKLNPTRKNRVVAVAKKISFNEFMACENLSDYEFQLMMQMYA